MGCNVERIRDRFIEAGGHLTQALGVGRTLGQIYAYCYFSLRPQTLDDLTEALKISKGGASMAVRQLEQWGALRRVWVKGDRKVYYEASTLLGQILRRILSDVIGHQMEEADRLLSEAENALKECEASGDAQDLAFIRSRVERFRLFRDKAGTVWNSALVRRLLK